MFIMEVHFYIKQKNSSETVWSKVVGFLMNKEIWLLAVPVGLIPRAPQEVKLEPDYFPKFCIH